MAVNWGLLQQGQDPGQRFQQAYDAGIQRQDQQALRGFQQEQMQERRATRAASVAAGTRIAAGDYPGAIAAAAPSGDLDLIRAISTMSQEQRAQTRARNQAITPLRMQARQLPVEQRRAFIASVAPRLQSEFGMTPEQIAAYDPSDQQLDADIALGMTMEQALAQGSLNWEGVAGGEMFATDSQGRPVAQGDPRLTHNARPAPPQAPAPGQPQEAPAATPTAAAPYAAGVAAELARNGVSQPVIAGILGNGHHESGGRWNNAAAGDGGTAHGAFQWRHGRVDNFQRVTGAHPRDASPEQTAQFVLWELQNPEQAGMTRDQAQSILSARTPEEAALRFSQHYERPNARLAHNDRRASLASRYAGQQTAQAGSVPTPGQAPSVQDQAMTGRIPRPAPQGFEAAPGGGIRPMRGSQPEFERNQATQNTERQSRAEISQIRQQFRQDPEVRQFRQVRIATEQIRRLGQSETAASDMGLIFSFMRVLDPSSTVREGEFATAQNSASWSDRVRNFYNQARAGTRLSPTQRQQMSQTAYQLYLPRAESYNEVAEQYREDLRALGITDGRELGNMVPHATGPGTEARRRQQRGNQQPPRQGRTQNGVRWRIAR